MAHRRVTSGRFVGCCQVSRGDYESIIAPSLSWEKWRRGGRMESADIGTVRDKQRTIGEANNRDVKRRAYEGTTDAWALTSCLMCHVLHCAGWTSYPIAPDSLQDQRLQCEVRVQHGNAPFLADADGLIQASARNGTSTTWRTGVMPVRWLTSWGPAASRSDAGVAIG